jgi:hypothetical protein
MPKKQRRPETVDYEHLGRQLHHIFEAGYADRTRLYKMSFMRGLFMGLGSIIGATIVVTLVIWVLSLLGYVPVVRHVVEPLQDALQTETETHTP